MRIAVDASALVAILLKEPDAASYLDKLLLADRAWISPVNWWEVQARILSRYGTAGAAESEKWMEANGVKVEPVGAEQARIAFSALAQYKSRPARLNLGDCFAYALAKTKQVPLLFKGNDFQGTDIEAA